jgi:hypothetical protein
MAGSSPAMTTAKFSATLAANIQPVGNAMQLSPKQLEEFVEHGYLFFPI